MKKIFVNIMGLCMCSLVLTGCGMLIDGPVMLGQQVEEAQEEAIAEMNSAYLEIAGEVYEEMSSGDALFDIGVDAYLEGDFDTAITKLKLAEEKGLSERDLTELYSILGNAYLETEDFDNAFDAYNIALEREPENVTCIVNLAIAYRQYGDNEKAMELYKQALLIDPYYPELNSSLGSLYVIEGQPELAIIYFEKALAEDSTLSVTYGNAALAYAMTGNFEKADDYLLKAEQLGYQNADVIRSMIDDLRNDN